MNAQSELASWFGDQYGKINVAFTSNLSTNGAVMVGVGLVYSLVIEGAALWDRSKITYRPLFPPLAAMKFINQMKCFLGMGSV